MFTLRTINDARHAQLQVADHPFLFTLTTSTDAA